MSDTGAAPREPRASGSHFQPSPPVVLVLVVLFVIATVLMLRSTTPSSTPTGSPTTTNSTTTSSTTTTSTIPIVKSKTTVIVLNSTTVTGLAARYTSTLETAGWNTLSPTNTAAVSASIIYYTGANRQAALDVAAELHWSSTVVHPLGTSQPVAGASSDDVIVILGPNAN